MTERNYQGYLIKKIKRILPVSLVLKNDPAYIQGFPDLTILNEDKWGALEVKISEDAPRQPNQEYYIDLLGSMSFASFIYPEIEEDVLDGLQEALQPSRAARLSKR